MSKGNSTERARMMSALGAEIILVDQLPGSVPGQISGGDLQRVEEAARRITEERKALRADQFQLPGNFTSHYLRTGPVLWSQSGSRITTFCDFVGSGGNYAGVATFLKEHI